MQMSCVRTTLAIIACSLFSTIGYAATIDFETVPLGMVYGQDAGNFPTQIVLTQDNIDMSVETFHLDSYEGLYLAQIISPNSKIFDTQALSLNNISVLFDFSHVGFAVDRVTFEFGDPGGASNFMVNNEILHILDPITDLPFDVAFGVTASVNEGLITLTSNGASINSLLIGGQEIVIDNVVAVPDPATGLLLLTGAAVLIRRKTHCKIS